MTFNQRNLLTTETRTHEGRTFRVDVVFDENTSAPWDEYCTLGTVTDWTRDRKDPGLRPLADDRGAFRYYDWAGAVAKARKEGMTGADAAEAVEREFTRLRRWCNDEWHWVGVVVTPLTPDGDALDSMSDSLWGIESDADDHIDEVARDLMYSLTKTLNEKEQPVQTIKIVPTWRGILPLLVEAAANGDTPKARAAAMDELYRLADIVDERNAQAAEESK